MSSPLVQQLTHGWLIDMAPFTWVSRTLFQQSQPLQLYAGRPIIIRDDDFDAPIPAVTLVRLS